MKQQTAVEWFVEFIQDHCIRIPENIIEKVKTMEKQQMNNAWASGIDAYLNNEDLIKAWAGFKKYYKKKYGKVH